MFEGKGGYLLPVNNQKAIDARMFYVFGKALVLSSINGGPGFPHFPHYIVSYLRGEEFMHELTTQCVVNSLLTDYIEEVKGNASTYASIFYLQYCYDNILSLT